jgi:hypothetical protein
MLRSRGEVLQGKREDDAEAHVGDEPHQPAGLEQPAEISGELEQDRHPDNRPGPQAGKQGDAVSERFFLHASDYRAWPLRIPLPKVMGARHDLRHMRLETLVVYPCARR